MRKICRLAVVATISITVAAASAQQKPAPGNADKQGQAGERRDTSPLTELVATSLTGCLVRGDEADPFILTVSDTGTGVTVTGSGDLAKHVGHTVTVHGAMKSEGRYFHATEVEHVAAHCIEPKSERNELTDTEPARTGRGGLTADQQSNKASDRKTTQAIRQAIIQDKSLSFSAYNVKIITRSGVVTLRGQVRSEQEKASVEAQAAAIAGAGSVRNELTVNRKDPAEKQRNK